MSCEESKSEKEWKTFHPPLLLILILQTSVSFPRKESFFLSEVDYEPRILFFFPSFLPFFLLLLLISIIRLVNSRVSLLSFSRVCVFVCLPCNLISSNNHHCSPS